MGFLALLLLTTLAGTSCDGERRYQGAGVVEQVLPGEGQIVIAHQDIPGLMDAMTMSFDVADEVSLAQMSPGERVKFWLSVSGSRFRIVALEPVDRVAGRGGSLPSPLGEESGVGLAAPDFALIDQAGLPLALGDLSGTNLLVDFIFTQCEGPCPILTAKHVAVQRALAPEVAKRSWFVSISLDPVSDTPEALEAYALGRGADLSRWSFLTGPAAEVAEVVRRWGVGTSRQPDGKIVHLVASFLVDAEGRIARRYLGLEHSSAAIASDLTRLAQAAAATPSASASFP